MSGGGAALQGLGGYIGQGSFGTDIGKILSSFGGQQQPQSQLNSLQDTYKPASKGFEQEPQYYDYRTGIMGNR